MATGHEDGHIHVWDAVSGQGRADIRALGESVLGGGGSPIVCLAFAPSGDALASCDNGGIVPLYPRRWDPAFRGGGQAFQGQLQGRGRVSHVAWAPTGTLLATVDSGGAVRLWDGVTHLERGTLRKDEVAGNVAAIEFSPDARTLAICQGKTLTLWDPATGLERLTLWQATQDIRSLAFAPDGKTLAAATDHELRLFHAATQEEADRK